MPEETVLRFCSPTLAGLKTASLFQYSVDSKKRLFDDLRLWNKFLCAKGLRALPLSFEGGRALIYIYRPSHLVKDLECETARRLLEHAGYMEDTPETMIGRLIAKLKSEDSFPHEIGLFLGYPPEDVAGFIENKAKNYKWRGLWKVYGDVEEAKKLQSKYDKCTNVYLSKWQEGRSLEQLTVCI